MVGTVYTALRDVGLGNIALIFVIVSLFVDLIPTIKFHPVRYVINLFGTAFNKSVNSSMDEFKDDMYNKIDSLEERMSVRMDILDSNINELKENQVELSTMQNQLSRALDESEIDRLKSSVLSFSNRLSKGEKFSIEEYRAVMDQYMAYHHLIEKYSDMENGKMDVEYEAIVKHYTENKECGESLF